QHCLTSEREIGCIAVRKVPFPRIEMNIQAIELAFARVNDICGGEFEATRVSPPVRTDGEYRASTISINFGSGHFLERRYITGGRHLSGHVFADRPKQSQRNDGEW